MPSTKVIPSVMTHVDALVVSLHVLLATAIYYQVAGFDYVYFDDDMYVIYNHMVRQGLTTEGIAWAFTSLHFSNWHPLAWISHMVDVSIADIDPGWAHVHNAIIHCLTSLLVYVLCLQVLRDRTRAAFLSIIFLVHPQHVESVAWIAERKDVLCGFFFVLGLICYHQYRQQPRARVYLLVVTSFVLAVLSKPMAVTFPVVIVILDVMHYDKERYFTGLLSSWRNRRIPLYVLDKIPLFLVSLMVGLITILAQDRGGAVADMETVSVIDRIANAGIGYSVYIKQFFLPTDLAIFYPFDKAWPAQELALPVALILGWIGLALVNVKKRPLIMVGLLWYLCTLLPVIGLIQVGAQSHADRYMYIPSIGLLLALSYLIPNHGHKRRAIALTITTAFTAFLTILCYWQVGHWENRTTLFSHALRVTGSHWRIHVHMAGDYLERKLPMKALEHGRMALDLRPDIPMTYRSMGNIAMDLNEPELAANYYVKAVALGSVSPSLYNNLGVAFGRLGMKRDAAAAFDIALNLSPGMDIARKNRQKYTEGGDNPAAQTQVP